MFIENALADTDTITIQDTSSNELAAPKAMGASSGWTSMIPMVLIFVVFYFLLIRPQEKRRRAQEELVSGVKKGEEILTSTGIFGNVTKINDSDNTVIVQIAKDVEIKMLKNSIANIVSREAKDTKQAKKIAEKNTDKKKKTSAKTKKK